MEDMQPTVILKPQLTPDNLPNACMTTHGLDFLVAPWEYGDEWSRFNVGTCFGLWRCTSKTYEILAVDNTKPGNGHFTDVLEWFEHSCKRDKKALKISELWNGRLYDHLINKRGFTPIDELNVIKRFDAKSRLKRTTAITRIQGGE